MKSKQEARAELLEMLGIDAILKALHLYCHGGNCNDCMYCNKNSTCNALEKILQEEDFVAPDEIAFGDNIEDEEEYDE